MSSKPKNKILGTLSLRLTILYSGVFILSTIIAFWVIYVLTGTALDRNVDKDLLDDIEEMAALLEEDGLEDLKDELLWEVRTDGSEQVFFRLFDNQGSLLFSTDTSAWDGLADGSALVGTVLKENAPRFTEMSLGEDEVRARLVIAPINEEFLLQIGEALAEEEEYLEIFTEVFSKVMLLMIFISALIGWFMSRWAMTGVEDVTQTALNIAGGEFTRRVPLKSRGSEIEGLAEAFNYMIDRIQSLLNGIREVTDNIAHDLRSPLASIRGTTELTLMTANRIEDYQDMGRNTIEECDRLIAMINAMLDISEAEAGAARMEVQTVNLCQVVKQACDLYLPLAEEKELTLALQGPVDCHLEGDLKKLQRLVSNLLDNAFKYTPAGGVVNVSVSSFDDYIEMTIEDNGIGIDAKDLPFVFQRFYRCDESRAQNGSGLGLSLALAIVKAHSGTIDAESHLGNGSRFVVKLPLDNGPSPKIK